MPRPSPVRHPASSFADHRLGLADPGLMARLSLALGDHITRSTQSSYNTATRSFFRFCTTRGFAPFPVDPVVLSAFIVYEARWVSLLSLKLYLSGIRSASIDNGFPWLLDGDPLCARALRAMKRRYGCPEKTLKVPLSFALLIRLFRLLPGWPCAQDMSHDDRLFVSASLIASTGFLRGGEFLSSARSCRPILRAQDVALRSIEGRLCAVVSIRSPKARWWVKSQDVVCFPPPASSDPGSPSPALWWHQYFSLSVPPLAEEGPAFVLADGSTLSRNVMVRKTSSLVCKAELHLVDPSGRPLKVLASSWRAGGVASARLAGVSDATIMSMGRWSSSAWLNYSVPIATEIPRASDAMWNAAVPEARLR